MADKKKAKGIQVWTQLDGKCSVKIDYFFLAFQLYFMDFTLRLKILAKDNFLGNEVWIMEDHLMYAFVYVNFMADMIILLHCTYHNVSYLPWAQRVVKLPIRSDLLTD